MHSRKRYTDNIILLNPLCMCTAIMYFILTLFYAVIEEKTSAKCRQFQYSLKTEY